MKVQSISFTGNIFNGKKEFEKLPLVEQVVQKSLEKFRQEFNQTHYPPIPAKDTDLAEYVRHLVFIERIVKTKMKDIIANVRKEIKT